LQDSALQLQYLRTIKTIYSDKGWLELTNEFY
jgi:hypothetical protein